MAGAFEDTAKLVEALRSDAALAKERRKQ